MSFSSKSEHDTVADQATLKWSILIVLIYLPAANWQHNNHLIGIAIYKCQLVIIIILLDGMYFLWHESADITIMVDFNV